MTEDGTVSIVKRGSHYQVHYASNNPQGKEQQPWVCPDEVHLCTLLRQLGIEAAAITHACADVRTGGMAVLFLVVSAQQRQASFRPTLVSA